MEEIRRISKDGSHWLKIFADYVLRGIPFILDPGFTEEWSSRRDWVGEDEKPEMEKLKELYGEELVPVVHGATGDVTEMLFREYVEYCCSTETKTEESLYLKDWHFQKQCSSSSSVYEPPPFLACDWVNNEKWTEDGENPLKGDYRFLYFGAKGTWTGFHSDVLSSHSWSANICGRKLWLMVPRGNEKIFAVGNEYIKDIRTRKDLWSEAGVFSFIQEPGETVFVPSNLFHQVHNLETTISLNHNSINASNVGFVWEFLKRRTVDVEKEIGHLRDEFTKEEWKQQVQLILGADARLNFPRLADLLHLVISDRSLRVSFCYICPKHSDPRSCATDSDCLSRFRSNCVCSNKTCPKCADFLASYELSVAICVLKEVEALL